MSSDVRRTDIYEYFSGQSDHLEPFTLPPPMPQQEWQPEYTPDGVMVFNPPSLYRNSAAHIFRLLEFAAAAPVDPANARVVDAALPFIESVNSGSCADPVHGPTSTLWRYLFVLYRSDHFSGGTLVDQYLVGASRIANELARRMESTRVSGANPWTDLGSDAPYILPQDMAVLRGFPRQLEKLHGELLPNPFIGKPSTARVLILSLNPGYSDVDHDDETQGWWTDSIRRNLTLDPASTFYVLRDELVRTSGERWWFKHLRGLRERVPPEAIATGLANVEWFPYHSVRFTSIGAVLPSQRFTFAVVRRAIEAGAIVVMTRASAVWHDSVPALRQTDVITLHSPQNPSISPGNMEPHQFERIVAALTSDPPEQQSG